MLISHRYKFIYLKTEKTASTSIWDALHKIITEKDQLIDAVPSTRQELLQKHGSLENFSFFGGLGMARRSCARRFGLNQHASARDVRAFIGPELFDSYTKISSERNPWDRQISLFAHRTGSGARANLAQFSKRMLSPAYRLLHHTRLHNWEVYTVNEKVCVDHMIRFEHLNADFRDVLQKLGLDPEEHELPHRRNGGRRDETTYRKFYCERSRTLVKKWYRREIECFGYQF